MTADEVKSAIHAAWGGNYLVFSEVKDGPSYGTGMRKLDVLAIKKSWTPVTFKGVEVKTSRADFLGDTKWPEYMKVCNLFYWACPTGLIKPNEVGAKAGLLYYNPKTKRISTRKAAIFRPVEPDPYMLLYLLFWRNDVRDDRQTHMRDIRKELVERKKIGEDYTWFVAKALNDAQTKMRDLKAVMKNDQNIADEVRAWHKKHPNDYMPTGELFDLGFAAKQSRVKPHVLRNLRNTMENAVKIIKQIEENSQ